MEETPYRFHQGLSSWRALELSPQPRWHRKALFLPTLGRHDAHPRPSNAAIVNRYPALLKRAR